MSLGNRLDTLRTSRLTNQETPIHDFWDEVSELHVQKEEMGSKMEEMSQKLEQYEKRHKKYKQILKQARQEVEFLKDSLTQERRKYRRLNEDLQLALKVKQRANDSANEDVNIGGAGVSPKEDQRFPYTKDNESAEEVSPKEDQRFPYTK